MANSKLPDGYETVKEGEPLTKECMWWSVYFDVFEPVQQHMIGLIRDIPAPGSQFGYLKPIKILNIKRTHLIRKNITI